MDICGKALEWPYHGAWFLSVCAHLQLKASAGFRLEKQAWLQRDRYERVHSPCDEYINGDMQGKSYEDYSEDYLDAFASMLGQDV